MCPDHVSFKLKYLFGYQGQEHVIGIGVYICELDLLSNPSQVDKALGGNLIGFWLHW